MRKLFLCFLWFVCSLTVLSSAWFLTKNSQASQTAEIKNTFSHYSGFALVPEVLGASTANYTAADARAEILRQYLRRFQSPLEPYADLIVSTADSYGLDFNIIVAIAQCESNLCKKTPSESNNCWGYGIPTGAKSGTNFQNLSHGIESVGKLLYKYKTQYSAATPDQIGPIYAPPSALNGGSWAKCVKYFLEELK